MMSVRHLILAVFCVYVAAGCRSNDPSVELLETEMRWLEDHLYLLDDQLEQKCAQVASCRRENTALRRELNRQLPANSATPRRAAASTGASDADVESGELTPPNINLGEPSGQGAVLPRSIYQPVASRADAQVTPNEDAAAQLDPRVTRIELNSRLTGGYDFDGKPGHEGLLIVLEPQNESGNYVPLAAPTSIEVIDPGLSGPESRVARWDFTSEESSQHLRTSLLGKGIHLELPWPNQAPQNERLRVAARYVTPDGRALRAERTFYVKPVDTMQGNMFAWSVSDPAYVMPSSPIEIEDIATNDATPAPNPARVRAQNRSAERKEPSGRTSSRPAWKPYR